jgi:hypothetical protein
VYDIKKQNSNLFPILTLFYHPEHVYGKLADPGDLAAHTILCKKLPKMEEVGYLFDSRPLLYGCPVCIYICPLPRVLLRMPIGACSPCRVTGTLLRMTRKVISARKAKGVSNVLLAANEGYSWSRGKLYICDLPGIGAPAHIAGYNTTAR